MSRSHDVAYIAGVIDSDGCIRVAIAKRRGDCKTDSYHSLVSVQQVERQAVDLAIALFGGHIQIVRGRRPGNKSLFRWTSKNLRVAAALTEMLPFLRIKRAQAENAIHLANLVAYSVAARSAPGRGARGKAQNHR